MQQTCAEVTNAIDLAEILILNHMCQLISSQLIKVKYNSKRKRMADIKAKIREYPS